MTIYEIKQATQEKDFKVYKQDDGRFKIVAPRPHGQTIRYFNPINNTLERD